MVNDMDAFCINNRLLGLEPELTSGLTSGLPPSMAHEEVTEGLSVQCDTNEMVLPLYLSESEVRILLQMCASAPSVTGEALEALLFERIGGVLLTFSHIQAIEDEGSLSPCGVGF